MIENIMVTSYGKTELHWLLPEWMESEPEFFNFEGAQESIPRNQVRQAVYPGVPVRQPYSN